MADTPVVPDGDLYRKAAQFAERALARERAAEAALDAAWQTVRGDALAAQEALLERVSKAREAGTRTSPAWAYQQARLGAVLAEADAALEQFGQAATAVVTDAQEAAQRAALGDAATLVTEAAQEAVLGASFVPSQAGAVAAATGFLEDGTPLADLFRQVGAEALADGRAAITTGLALGKSPAWIARRFTKAMDLAPARARTIARTEALRVHRQVSSDTYTANADVLEGWVWTAALDSRSCTACIAMHGTIHGLDERLDGHPNCRCRMVPRTLPWDELAGRPTGAEDTRPAPVDGVEWFEGQPDSVKRQVLGPAKFAAYKRGDITLEDTVARTSSQRWGSMRRERSLDEIRRGKNANAPRVKPGTVTPGRRPAAAAAQQAAMTATELRARLDAQGGTSTLTGLRATDGGTSGETFTAALPDGTPVIIRTVSESDRKKLDAEELAHALAERLGVNVPAVVRTGPTETVATRLSGRVMAEGGTTFTDAERAAFEAAVAARPDQARRLALFDDLILHPDRHLGNVFLDERGDLYGIDQANRMPRTARTAGLHSGEFADLLEDAPRTIAEVDGMLEALDDVRALAERLDMDREWAAMRERMSAVRERAVRRGGAA